MDFSLFISGLLVWQECNLMVKQTRDKILQNRQMFEYCPDMRPQVLKRKVGIFVWKWERRIYIPNLCLFINSMDSITGYNPQDAAGFIRINALR